VRFRFASVAACACVALVPFAVDTFPASSLPVFQVAQSTERPVARIDPRRPIQIEVVNAGDAPITCLLTQPASAERIVPPGGKTTFGSTRTSYLPLPINFFAYPDQDNIGISSYVFVDGGVLTVVIGEQYSQASGDISMNVDMDGNIYLY
jgi:hypothetical protein